MKRRNHPSDLAHILPTVSNKAFGTHAKLQAVLLQHWDQIMDKQYAVLCWPSEIKKSSKQKGGHTLTIKVWRGAATELQYQTSQIMERANMLLGKYPISDIRFVSVDTLPEKLTSDPIFKDKKNKKTVALPNEIEDTSLRKALEELQQWL